MINRPLREQRLFTQEHAESSKAEETRSQTELHRFLQFKDIPTWEKYLNLRNLEVNTINSIDWNQIGIFDPDNRLAKLLPPGSPWRRFFDILEPSYDELVYEFWSSFRYKRHNNLTDHSIYFQLGGQSVNLSLTEFAIHSGIYTREEVELPIFTKALTYYPYKIQDYWYTHSSSKMWRKRNNSKTFIDPIYQYMHRVLANTIRGRTASQHIVNPTDLFHLYSIFESVPCNIAHSLAVYFEYYRTRPLKSLMGGSYITRIAKSLGIINDQVIQGLSPPKTPGIVNFNSINLTYTRDTIQTQSSQPEVSPAILTNTTTQNLQQLSMQLPQPSFYQSKQQLPPILEHIPTNQSQPQTPSIFQTLSPLPFGQEEMMQQFFDENLTFRNLLESEPPLSPPLQHSFHPHLTNQPEQQRAPIVEPGSSTVPLVNPHLNQMEIALKRLIEQYRKMSRQIEWLTKRNRWQEEMLKKSS